MRIPRSVWLRLAALVLIVLAGFAALRFTPLGEFLTKERIEALIGEVRGAWWSPLALIGLYVVLAPLGLPMSPLMVGGAVFGGFYGSLYNVIGLLIGAAVSFNVAKLLGRDFVLHITGGRLRRAERAFERHGFWPLVQTRFMPFPFAMINFGAALTGVKQGLFLTTTAIGLIPSTIIHTVFIANLLESSGRQRYFIGAAYLGTFMVFNLIIGIPWLREQWRRRQRYKAILAQRQTRSGGA